MEDTAQLDSIVEQTELSTNQEIPMEASPQEATQETQSLPQEYEFQSNGQTIKAPIEKILRWAAMGHAAPNRIGELSKKLSDYEGRIKQYEPYEKVYKPIDEWAKSNPDKWGKLVESWQQAQYGVLPQTNQQGQTNTQLNLPPEVIQKLQSHDQILTEFQQEKQVQRERASDQSLDRDIQSIRKSFSNIDFDAPDANGNSLEFQILEHATKNGIPSFRAAFRDYCFDHLTQMGKEKAAQASIPQKTKAGLLGKDPTPAQGRPLVNLKNRNYDQIHEAILAELGLSG